MCNGTGVIPGGHMSSSLFTTCPTCDGKRIISELTGLPPSFVNEEENKNEQGLSLIMLTETPEVCTTGIPLENENEARYSWETWAVCEVVSKNGNVYQCDEDAIPTVAGTWIGVTNKIHAKFKYMGSIKLPEDFMLTKIMRYK